MKNICFITGTRAEYGLLKPLMDLVASENSMSLQIIVTCMHLSPEFGLTYKNIENDGFKIDDKVEILLSSDTPIGICKSIGLGFIGLAESLTRLKPDLIILLGDRFETFAAATCALISRIPVAHLHGGELTEGNFDEALRHSITKMSHFHFTSNEEYRKRVIQLGEHPNTVFNVGAIGLDNIKKLKLLSKKELENQTGIQFKKKNLLITFHPVTLESSTSEKQFTELLKALDELVDTFFIFTKPNSDTDGRIIIKMIDDYVKSHSEKSLAFISMGQLNYLSCLQYVDAVVGNSSSGIIEAPSFKIATVNIGNRQSGRIKAESIIDCEPNHTSVSNAISQVYSQRFTEKLKSLTNPYGDGETSLRIFSVLKSLNRNITTKKQFFNLDLENTL